MYYITRFMNLYTGEKFIMNYKSASKWELKNTLESLLTEYENDKSLGLSLNMARGKPGKDQLALTDAMNNPAFLCDYTADDGTELRNYGVLDGIPECKKLFADILGVPVENIIVFGNSSLNIMYDTIAKYLLFGAGGRPWASQKIKFLCPVPGYDRHFAILEHFGIEMINIPMTSCGPDMDKIDELIKDESVKGIICVPMYSNPTGITFSDETVKRFASLKPAANDFRVIWDNAYCVHHLSDSGDSLLNIFDEAKKYGNEDFFIEVTSTSKITFPGSGVSALAASAGNIAAVKKRMTVQTIGYDKLNQKRHCAFLKDADGVREHMKKHAEILRPKFETVLNAFSSELEGLGIAEWTVPKGGYFISLNVYPGCAKRTVALCKEAGVTLTGAGATFPYGNDPHDSNIRIAPTFPSLDELKKAVEILCMCVKIACLEKLINE